MTHSVWRFVFMYESWSDERESDRDAGSRSSLLHNYDRFYPSLPLVTFLVLVQSRRIVGKTRYFPRYSCLLVGKYLLLFEYRTFSIHHDPFQIKFKIKFNFQRNYVGLKFHVRNSLVVNYFTFTVVFIDRRRPVNTPVVEKRSSYRTENVLLSI